MRLAKSLFTLATGVAFTGVMFTTGAFAQGNSAQHRPVDPGGIQRLMSATGGKAKVSVHPANGAARFVRLPANAAGSLAAGMDRSASAEQKSAAFLNQNSSLFGIRNPSTDLKMVKDESDKAMAGKHLTYQQYYNGVPVFAGILKTHFNEAGELRSVNGNVVPNISLNASPTYPAHRAEKFAVALVSKDLKRKDRLTAQQTTLYVFQAGLAKGVDLGTFLTWQVEVGNRKDVREFVFIDAHNGKLVDQITGTPDSLNRRAYDGQNLNGVPPSYPGSPFWVEGQAFPTGNTEADNMITSSQETYDFYSHAFGRDSFDGAGATMDSIFNRGYSCPNASWNGTFISFCPGFTTDDVTAHEWSHAYTQYTDNLIYQWQPGALNEAYSDIWGETVDRMNSRGTDNPGGARTAGACSTFSPPKGVLTLTAPAGIAGDYPAQSALFGPPLTGTGVSGDVIAALDAADPTGPTTFDGCTAPFTNAADVAGKIAVINRGTCTFSAKVYNAQQAGAIGVIIENNAATGLPGMGAGVNAGLVTIPSLGVTQAAGEGIRANTGVTATLHSSAGAADDSVRWLMGEDVGVTNGTGALRDMWSPNCYSNPDRVSDRAYYVCSTADNGGVHTNSGVPNKAYALLVDGGTFNGQTISALGFTKAAHIYFRAQSVYQGPASDFAEHADSIEQSCSDLIGTNLADIQTGAPSNQIITAGDCDQVAKATLATEMRTPPTQCGFTAILAKTPPDRCAVGTTQVNLFNDDFEATGLTNWSVSHNSPSSSFISRDWLVTPLIPNGRTGSALFGANPDIGNCSTSDQSGVLHADSKSIVVPEGAIVPLLTFDHWVATEVGWDGGNLKVSVNGGPWTLVARDAFVYNRYNAAGLNTVAQGNTDPLAGQAAFTGTDGGAVGGSWGRSHVNLSAYAHPGDSVRLRYDMGSDGCTGIVGWYVDDVTLYACPSSNAPLASINNPSTTEGNSGVKNLTFTVTLSEASAQSITVGYKVIPGSGTAKNGTDYLPAEGTLTFPPLTLTRQVSVQIKGDRTVEPDETFHMILRNAIGAGIGAGDGVGTILNDD